MPLKISLRYGLSKEISILYFIRKSLKVQIPFDLTLDG